MSNGVPGTLVGAGRSADVYDLGNGRVLRRYRDQRPPERVAAEAEVMARARRFGVPVPEVFEVSGRDIVMERVDGPTMVEAIGRRPWTGGAQVRSLARLHELVHRVPASGLTLPPFGPPGDRDDDVLLHRDLHPQNVILAADGPMIIDWESAARGPAAADIAMTWAIITFSDIPGSRLEAVVLVGVRALLTRSFLRAAGPPDDTWRTLAVQRRLADPHVLPSEAARMRRWSGAARSSASPSPASPSTASPSTASTSRGVGPRDAGPRDAGPRDAGPRDAGSPDAGAADVGAPDAGAPDAGAPDVGAPDVGAPGAGG